MTGEPESGPVLRAESGDEVLDAAVAPDGRGPRSAGRRLADRHPTATRALAVVLLVAVTAAAAGKWRHDADRQDAAAATRSRVMLRLLGGGGAIDLEGGAEPPDGGLAVRLTFPVRDDGPAPIDILAASLHDSGVDVVPARGDDNVAPAGRPVLTEVQPAAGSPLVVAPGQAVLVTMRAEVDCLDRGLPPRPGALSLTVRTADGRVRQVVLPDPRGSASAPSGSPASAGTSATSAPAAASAPPSTADSGDYYAVCGASQTSITPLVVYNRLVGYADPTARTFSYQVTVTVQGDSRQSLQTAEPAQSAVPGLSTTTDLASPAVLDPGATRKVVVTVHATDCAGIAQALGMGGAGDPSSGTPGASGGGPRRTSGGAEGSSALGIDALFVGTALAITPGDPRYPQAPVAVDPPASPAFYADVLTQLRAACPVLN